MVDCIEVAFASERYQALLALREQQLRAPLGVSLTAQDTCCDHSQWHYAALVSNANDAAVVGGVIIAPGAKQTAQLRQMVVDKAWQGYGVGAALLRFAHEQAINRGVKTITLNARDSAVGFYTRFGYRCSGDSHKLLNVVHWPMTIELSD